MLQGIYPAGQRQHQRYRVEAIAFATLYWDQEMILGILLNISQGGLAFKYIPQENEHDLENKINSELRLDIFTQDSKVVLKSLPCKLIYKKPQPRENRMCQLQMNKCAIQFQALNQEQSDKLIKLLELNGYPGI